MENVQIFDSMPQGSGLRMDAGELRARCADFAYQTCGWRKDSGETALFARQIEYIYTETFDKEYPEFRARYLLPVDTRVNTGADSYTYRGYEKLGQAAIVHSYAKDFPEADVAGSELKRFIRSLGTSYSFSIQDMRAAAMAGVPLEAKKADAAKFAMESLVDKIAASGDSNSGLYGFCNAPGIGQTTKLSTGTWQAQVTANAATAAVSIVADVNALQNDVFTKTDGVHSASTLVLPVDLYSLISTTPMAPTFGNPVTILKFVLESSPWLKEITYWNRLNNLAYLQGGSAGAHGLIMAYDKNPRVVSMIVPQEFEQLPPQPVNMTFSIPCHMRHGGVEVRYPVAVTTMVGAD